MKDIEDTAGVSISTVELAVVGRPSIADASVSEAVGVGMTTAEDDRYSTLDGAISGVVAIGGNAVESVDRLNIGSTEDSMVAEVGMALPTSLTRLESVSIVTESKDSGRVAGSDVAVAS